MKPADNEAFARALDQVDQQYREAVQSLTRFFESESPLESTQLLSMIASALADVDAMRPSIATAQQKWQLSRNESTPQLKDAVARHQQTLEELLEIISLLEHRLGEARNRIEPEVDQLARATSMRSAYADAMRQR